MVMTAREISADILIGQMREIGQLRAEHEQMHEAMREAINELVEHWNTKDKQRVALPPDWAYWLRGVSDGIDKVIDACEAQRARDRGEREGA